MSNSSAQLAHPAIATAKGPALAALLNDPRVWRGQAALEPSASVTTGHPELDAALPQRGWPEAALSEILFAADGLGELRLVLPTLAMLTQAGLAVLMIGPPYQPYGPALQRAGLALKQVHVVQTQGADALWASEQCLRSGACAAVLSWPLSADDRALRRLQLAAETGRTLGFVLRPLSAARNASPAALRLTLEASLPAQLPSALSKTRSELKVRVLKCRGGHAQPGPITLRLAH